MNKKFYFTLAFVLTLSVFPDVSTAGVLNVYIKEPTETVFVGEPTVFKLYVDTGGNEINVLEGSFRVVGLAEIVGVNKEGSVFSLWPEDPEISNKQEVSFTGGTPGGVFGKDLRVFDLSIVPESAGTISFKLDNLAAYLNDGVGTKVSFTANDFKIETKEKRISKNSNLFYVLIITLIIIIAFYLIKIFQKRKK
jgi:hypothetical protein